MPLDVPAGTTPAEAAEATAILFDEAERHSPALRRSGSQAMLRAGFEEVFNHLDPYSRYLTPEEARESRERRLGAPELGLTLAAAPRRGIVVSAVSPEGAAARAGVRPGDLLLAADGVRLDAGQLSDALSLLEGPPGSGLLLTLQRGRARRDVLLTRAAPAAPGLRAELRDGVLWISLPTFSARSGGELREALARAPQAPLVLDLRGNRGGLLASAVEVASHLLPPGPVALTEGRHPEAARRLVAEGPDLSGGRPLVVLVDGRTASAAEVVAAALADRERAAVLGSVTLGKGLIQVLVPLPGGAELALSWSRLLAPSGWPIQSLGVLPGLCTSLGAEAMARHLAALSAGERPLALPLDRARAARAPLPASELAALRGACPPAEGREADLAAARALLDRPEALAAATRR